MMRGAVVLAFVAATTAQASELQVAPGASLQLAPSTRLDLGCADLRIGGAIALGDARIARAGDLTLDPGGALAVASGEIEAGGSWRNGGSFVAGTGRVVFSAACGGGPVTITGSNGFHDLTLQGGDGRSFTLPAGALTTVAGQLRLEGTGAAPIRLASAGPGVAIVRLGPAASVTRSNVDVPPTVQIGAASSALPEVIPIAGAPALLLLAALLALFGRGALVSRPTAGRPAARSGEFPA